jgi:hypothetical protein
MQHALAYTYDRVKFVYLLAMVAAVLVGWFGSRTLTAGLLLLGTVTLIQFVTAARGPDPLVTYWRHLDAHYGALIQQAARDDESVFMTGPVRGSKTYYSRRNIVELPSRFDDPDETIRRNGDFIRERTRTAGAQTALVVLPRDEIPVFQSGFHSAFPRPASLYRLDVSTGAFVRLAPVTP